MDVSRVPTNHEQNGGHAVWKMSSVAYNHNNSNNGQSRSPQKVTAAAAAGSGPTVILCENGSSPTNSDLARSHPELAAHLLNSSGSSTTSPQSRRYSSGSGGGGSGNGPAAGFPPSVSHQQPQQSQQQRQLARASFQQQQQQQPIMEPFDDSGQGYGTPARGHASYLLSGDDPFLGASSSSGFPAGAVGNNTSVGASAMGVVMMSPVSSELSVESPHSITVVAASTGANAGVGLVSAAAVQQQPKSALPAYVYASTPASGARFSTDYQSSSPLVPTMVTLDNSGQIDQPTSHLSTVRQDTFSPSAPTSEQFDNGAAPGPEAAAAPPPPPPPQPAAPTNKKVIRLKQKKRHLRMIGPYRQIPAVSHMCKILEDLDFDRKDLFPLGKCRDSAFSKIRVDKEVLGAVG